MTGATTSEPESATGGWLPRAFWRIWWATGIDGLGDGAWVSAIPLLVVARSGGPGALSAVAVATYLPWLLVSPTVGVLLDRFDRFRILAFSQSAQALIASCLAVLVAVNAYSVSLVVGLSFMLGVAEVFASNAHQVALPHVVATKDLARANSRLASADSLSNQLIGPPLGGLLVGIGAYLALGLNALTFALSVVVILPLAFGRSRVAAGGGSAGGGGTWSSVADGWRFIRRQGVLLSLVFLFAGSMIANQVVISMLALLVRRETQSNIAYGAVLSGAAIGGLLASLVAHKIVVRLGDFWSIVLSVCASAAVLLVPTLIHSIYAIGVSLAGMAGAGVIWNVVVVTLRQRVSPSEQLGRVNSTFRMAGWGLLPVGSILGGLVASSIGLSWVFSISATLRIVILLLCLPWLFRGLRGPVALGLQREDAGPGDRC